MNDYALMASCQYVTPECRENRGAEGAIDEALRRVREAYMECVDAEGNADARWHVVLYRVEGEAADKLAMIERPSRSQSNKVSKPL